MIMLEYQNTKTFLLKDIFQIGLNKFLWLKTFHGHMLLMIYVINTVPCTYVISDLDREEIIEIFY